MPGPDGNDEPNKSVIERFIDYLVTNKPYDTTVASATKRFGVNLAAHTTGVGRDVFFVAGSALTRTGDLLIRPAEIVNAGGKEMFKLALKIKERIDHQNSTGTSNETKEDCDNADTAYAFPIERTLRWLTYPFIGRVFKPEFKIPFIDDDKQKHTVFVPGLISGPLLLAAAVLKVPGFTVWLAGEAIKTVGRVFGLGRDHIKYYVPPTLHEKHLREAKQKNADTVGQVFDRVTSPQRDNFRRIHVLIGASMLRQLGLALALPGRLVHWVGHIISELNLVINDALMIVSNWSRRTLVEYALNLKDASANQSNPFIKGATLSVAGLTGLVGSVLWLVPKLASFANNFYTGLPGFILETAGKLLKLPGMFVTGISQRISSDPRQAKTTLDSARHNGDGRFPLDFNAKRDGTYVDFDPEQTISVTGKLYDTFVRRTASEKTTLDTSTYVLVQRYKLLRSKGATADDAGDPALKHANGVLAQNLAGHIVGFGETNACYEPTNTQKTLAERNGDAIRTAAGSMKFAAPTLEHDVVGFWTRRSAAARWLNSKLCTLDADDRNQAFTGAADGAGQDHERSPLLEKGAELVAYSSVPPIA